MAFFDRMKKAVKGFMEKTGAATGVAQEFKDIFQVGGVPAFNQFYYWGIFVWKFLYRGFYNAWHLIPAPSIADPASKRIMYRMEMPKASCAELASLVWSEECTVDVTREGVTLSEDETDPLNEFVHSVLVKNAFWQKMQGHVEQSAALGGGAVKVWYEEKRDENGNVIPGTGNINLGYCMADQFVPTAWDNAKVTEGVFISRIAKDGYYYTRLEWHKWNGETYFVTNELFRSEIKNPAKGTQTAENPQGNVESQDILGYRYPLSIIYPFLNEVTPIHGLEQSLFSYYRMPQANNLDDNSPLGMSIFANSLSTLRAIDICYDSLVREFRLGRKRIIVPARCVRTVIDPETQVARRYFDASDETYEALNIEDVNDLTIKDNSIELRVQEHVDALNILLKIYCLQVGFSPSTFTFDMDSGLKTATEVISENGKTYKTVKSVQNQLRDAVESLVRNIIAVAALYDMEWDGQKIAALAANGFNVNITFDDGITQDRQTNINEGILLCGAGLMSKYTFLTDPKYGQGLTPEDAAQELARIKAEQTSVQPEDWNNIIANTAE